MVDGSPLENTCPVAAGRTTGGVVLVAFGIPSLLSSTRNVLVIGTARNNRCSERKGQAESRTLPMMIALEKLELADGKRTKKRTRAAQDEE